MRFRLVLAVVVFTLGSQARAVEPLTRYQHLRAAMTESIAVPAVAGTFDDLVHAMRVNSGVKIIIDAPAFVRAGTPDVSAEKVKLPNLNGLSRHTVLRLLAGQVGGAVCQQGDAIFIVPQDERGFRLARQPVDVDFIEKPVAAALRELQLRTGAEIELDDEELDKERILVTVSLRGVPADEAVLEIARRANLFVFRSGDAQFVTTPARMRHLDLIAQ